MPTKTNNNHKYSGVIAQTDSEIKLIAPDDTTVSTYDEPPSVAKAKTDLADAGYGDRYHVPTRDMRISDETLPGDLTL